MLKLFIFLAVCVMVSYADVINKDTLKLSVYYESLCSDSVRFFKNQLNNTYELIGDYFSVDLIPYGFANQQKIDGKWTFHCQHGPKECSGNKYHACELAQNHGEAINVKFVSCAMTSKDPSSPSILQKCAESVGIDFDRIKDCAENGQGDDLLLDNGRRTDAVVPAVSYIPTLIINDVYNIDIQTEAEYYLLDTICERLPTKPPGCPK